MTQKAKKIVELFKKRNLPNEWGGDAQDKEEKKNERRNPNNFISGFN